MFAKLALRNVRRQISNYLIYFVSVALSMKYHLTLPLRGDDRILLVKKSKEDFHYE